MGILLDKLDHCLFNIAEAHCCVAITKLTKAYVAKTSRSQLLLIDSAMYVHIRSIIEINLLIVILHYQNINLHKGVMRKRIPTPVA